MFGRKRPDNAEPADRFAREALGTLFETHDEAGLTALRAHVTSLPWGEEALRLGRALAEYEDQRGWRREAEDRYTALLSMAEGAGDSRAVARLHADLAEMAHRWGDHTAMAAHIGAARDGLQQMGARLAPAPDTETGLEEIRLDATVLRIEAILTTEQGDTARALRNAGQALALFGQIQDSLGQAFCLNTLCYICVKSERFADAASYTGMVLAGNMKALPAKLQAWVYSNHGYAIRRVNGPRAALPFYTRALEVHRARRDPLGQRTALASLGSLYETLRRTQDAEQLYREGIAGLEASGAQDQAGVLYNNLALLQFRRGEYQPALASFNRALALAEDLGNERSQAITCANVGQAWMQLGDAIQAADWWERSSMLQIQVGAPAKAIALLQQAIDALGERAPERARHIRERVEAIQREIDASSRDSVAVALRELAALLARAHVTAEELFTAVQAVAVEGKKAGQLTRDHAVRELAERTATATLGQAGLLAAGCAMLVQSGASASEGAHAVLMRLGEALQGAAAFAQACRAAAGNAEDDGRASYIDAQGPALAASMPEEAQAWSALHPLCGAAFTMLAASAEARMLARRDGTVPARLQEFPLEHEGVRRIRELLSVLDDEELLVLHVALGRGYRVRIRGVSGNFQLHTLLMGALIGDEAAGWLPGTQLEPRVLAAAQDGAVHPGHTAVTGAWDMVNWRGLRADGTLGGLVDGAEHWIWGEGVPGDIAQFEGQRIVLLGPASYQRSWNAGRAIPQMHGEARVEDVLSAGTVQEWLRRLAAAR